jgi:TRAP-type mannitol/chloroaromatic compound transport system substrate-binding protein
MDRIQRRRKAGVREDGAYYYFPCGGLRQWLPLHQQRQWAELAKSYQQMVTTVAEHVAGDRIAKYDSRNPPSIKRLVAAGARLRPVALDILDAC